MAQMIHALGARHRLALVALRGEDEPPIGPQVVERCEQTEELWRPEPGISRRSRGLLRAREVRAGLAGLPAWALLLRSKRIAHRLAQVAEDFGPEVVQLENEVMAQYLPALTSSSGVRMLVVHEPGTAAALERWRSARGWRRGLRRLDLRAWREFEREALQQMDATVVFTERDRRTLAALAPGASIFTVPLGTDIPPHPLDPVGGEPPSVVFVGNFTHPPNAKSAIILLTEIVPLVRRAVPALQAFVVGPRPPAELRRLADAGTFVTGAVEAVDPYLARASVVVAPMWSGGGMRVKVLEALAAGKALVATPLALEGLALDAGENMVVASTPSEFAHAIVELIEDRRRRARIAVNGRRWAVANLAWDTAVARYDRVWTEAIDRRRARKERSIPVGWPVARS
jgi:glycosyltransferase involved in cell wall biosynthesis